MFFQEDQGVQNVSKPLSQSVRKYVTHVSRLPTDPLQNLKFFKIVHHIESLDACIEQFGRNLRDETFEAS